MNRSTATVDDVFRLALPAQTELLAGAAYLNRPVSWACSLRPSPPAFPKLDGNELALVDIDDLRRLDPKMRIERVIRMLHNARVAGVAVQGISDDVAPAIAAARDNNLVLFQLPPGVPITQIERTVIRLIVDRAGYIAQRSADLQRELNQVALHEGGLERIADHLHRFVQQPVILLDENGRIAATSGLNTLAAEVRQQVLEGLPNLTMLRSWAATQPADAIAHSVGTLPIQATPPTLPYCAVVVAPVFASDNIHGYCLLLRTAVQSEQEVTAVEEVAAIQGASAVALEWAKQNAVGIAEERMRATFLDELLAAEIADEQAWIRRGASLGYDLTRPHIAMIVDASNVPTWPAPFLRYVHQRQVSAPYTCRNESVLIFWPTDNLKERP